MKRILGVLLLFACGLGVRAESRAVLRIRPGDRSIAIRGNQARATLSVVPRGARVPSRTVEADDAGVWVLDTAGLAGAGTLVAGGETLFGYEDGAGADGAVPDPLLLEAGDALFELSAPGGRDLRPADCTLRIDSEPASIRQSLPAAAVVTGEGQDARLVFAAWIGTDQAGPARMTLQAGAAQRSWDARVWSWRWVCESRTVSVGDTARFRLEIRGLDDGALCDVEIAAPPALVLEAAPAAFEPAGPGRWRVRCTSGLFLFRAAEEGRQEVVTDCTPCVP